MHLPNSPTHPPVRALRVFSPFQRKHLGAEPPKTSPPVCHLEIRQRDVRRPPLAHAHAAFQIKECHLPTNILVPTTAPEARALELLASPPAGAASLRTLRAAHPKIVHSFAQRQNPHRCRACRITLTHHYHLDKIDFESQTPASQPVFVHPLPSGQKPGPEKSRNPSIGPASDPHPDVCRPPLARAHAAFQIKEVPFAD